MMSISVFIFHWMSTVLNGYVLLKILFCFWVWPEGLWSWTTVNFSSIGTGLLFLLFCFFFLSSQCLLFFLNRHVRSINKHQNPQTTVIPPFSSFSSLTYLTVSQSRIDLFFFPSTQGWCKHTWCKPKMSTQISTKGI